MMYVLTVVMHEWQLERFNEDFAAVIGCHYKVICDTRRKDRP